MKAQRQGADPAGPAAELLRDLEMVAAIVNRASRRLAGAAVLELDGSNAKPRGARSSAIEPTPPHGRKNFRSKSAHVEPSSTHDDSGTARQGVGKREIARVLGVSRLSVRRVLRPNSAAVPELDRGEKAEPYRQQILDLLHSARGIWSGSMRSWWRRGGAVLPGADRLLPPPRDRAGAARGGGAVLLRAGRGDAA